jgi:tetratricopeptide (TPR) repeat protein
MIGPPRPCLIFFEFPDHDAEPPQRRADRQNVAIEAEEQQALVDEAALSAAERAHARLALGLLSFGQGDYERAAPALETAIDLYSQLADLGHVATALVPLGLIQAVGDPNGGEDQPARAVDTFRELDDQWGLAFAR